MDGEWQEIKKLVSGKKELLEQTMEYLWKNPELGYKEWKASAYLSNAFEKLGYKVNKAGDIPGFVAEYDTRVPGPCIGILGEMDALICEQHQDRDKSTDAVHACGHYIQTTILLGIAAVLADEDAGFREKLCGKICFIAVPAEETIDLAYREKLVNTGVIQYMAGKVEFLKRGLLDQIDMAMMFHVMSDDQYLFRMIGGCNGCITKHFEYEGVAAHAGGEPHKGINALYAASVGISACNALRETFQEQDYVRYHPIINQAGAAANAIPGLASMDTYVRAASFKKMIEVNKKINRALGSSAAALGANVLISDRPGNLPLHNNKELTALAKNIISELFGENSIRECDWDTTSTDVGDISSLIPVMQHYCAGASGTLHGADFTISDYEKAVFNPICVLLGMCIELLEKNAILAEKIMEEYKPLFPSKEAYFEALHSIERNERLVKYRDNDTLMIRY